MGERQTMPDIALLPALTQMLGVSADELFGHRRRAYQAGRRRLRIGVGAAVAAGRRRRRAASLARAAQRYPKDYNCLRNLADALLHTLYCGAFAASHADNAEECAALCERILRDCTDPEIRSSVLQTAVYLYTNPNAPVADEQKAAAYASMQPSLYHSRELLTADAYFTEEGRERALVTRHQLTLTLTDLLCRNLLYLRREDVSTEMIFLRGRRRWKSGTP